MDVLIVEDEVHTARRLEKMLKEIDEGVKVLDQLDSIVSSVEWFKSASRMPDLIFMDIRLADGLSFEIFSQVKILQPIIFTTAYDEYMLKAFKVNSIDYLLKPVEKTALQGSLQKFRDLKEAPQDIHQRDSTALKAKGFSFTFPR